MRDKADLSQVDEPHWQERNPVLTEALVHLTIGVLDCARDIAALVTKLEAYRMDLTLVNLSPGQKRQVLIRAGNFGEYRFETG